MGDLGGDGDQSEKPVRQVELSPFHIGATEITQGQWSSLMGESIFDLRKKAGFTGESPYGSGPNHPVYYVSWETAVEFCNRLTERERTRSGLSKSFVYRLPTEAEWEYACRAGWEEPFGGDPFEMGKIAAFGGTAEVGQFPANEFRLQDMHGNVWEWSQDYYRPNYSGLSTRDPVGPTSGDSRVFRGGSWLDGMRAARSSSRGFALPTLRHRTVGFRVVLAARP